MAEGGDDDSHTTRVPTVFKTVSGPAEFTLHSKIQSNKKINDSTNRVRIERALHWSSVSCQQTDEHLYVTPRHLQIQRMREIEIPAILANEVGVSVLPELHHPFGCHLFIIHTTSWYLWSFCCIGGSKLCLLICRSQQWRYQRSHWSYLQYSNKVQSCHHDDEIK